VAEICLQKELVPVSVSVCLHSKVSASFLAPFLELAVRKNRKAGGG